MEGNPEFTARLPLSPLNTKLSFWTPTAHVKAGKERNYIGGLTNIDCHQDFWLLLDKEGGGGISKIQG